MIVVKDVVEHASTYEDGDVIFRLIEPRLRAGETVTISFEGITAVNSSFVNGSIIRLVESMSVAEVRSRLRITKSTKQINDLIKGRMDFADDPVSASGKVSVTKDWEVVYWARLLGTSKEALLAAVKSVGTNAEEVRHYLKAHS